MSVEKTFIALVKAVKGITQDAQGIGVYGNPVRWPNADLQTAPNGPFVTVDVLFSEAEPVTLGKGGEDELTGILQVSLYNYLNKGEAYSLKFYDTLKAEFFAGAKFVEAETEVLISRYSIRTANEGRNRAAHFSAYWKTRFNRPVQN